MSKLLNLKEMITLDEAVTHISSAFGEPVTVADLYDFALKGYFKLSVYFANQANGVVGKWLKTDDIEDRGELDSIQSIFHPSKSPLPNEMFVADDNWIAWEDGVQQVSGIWDLTMQGDEVLDVKAYHQHLTSGFNVKVNAENGFGILVQQGDVVCQLYRQFQVNKYQFNGSPELVYEDLEKAKGDLSTNLFQHGRYSKIRDYEELELFHSLSFNKVRKNNAGGLFAPCVHLIDIEYIYVIKTIELTRFIQSFGGTVLEAKPPAQKDNKKNNDKQEYNKAQTQIKYSKWQRQAIKLKKTHPSKPKTWIAAQIAKLPIAEGKSADTIRKNIKI
ncbi:hypothetical protein ACFL6Z_00115 [Pseudomonadota bacterium]